MQMSSIVSFYPISIDDIKTKVARKNGRKNGSINKFKVIINEFGEKIIRIDSDIPVDLDINNGNRYLFISYDQSILTHGLHKYPAKFFPELPRWIIKRYSDEENIVLDPFSGSSTTGVEALLLKRNSVGIDVDPFSRFLSKVKTTPLDENELNISLKSLLKSIANYNPSSVLTSEIPIFPYRDNWFNKEIILELAYLRKIIKDIETNDDIKDFYKICFSSIIRAVSNADDNCTRTVIRKKLNKIIYPADALIKFTEKILTNVPKVIEFSQICPMHIDAFIPENMDARNIGYKENTFDLALTSPPYANAVDYPRTHQLESYWLNLAHGSLTPLKRKHVGTESVFLKDYKNLYVLGIKEADEVISNIYKKDKRRAYIAYKYLFDMRKNLEEVFRVLKYGARYVVVVGNNKIRGELLENWKYIMTMAENIGFGVENYFGSEIIKHFIKVPREERINTDWVIILKK